jgi:hypothetical protein
MRARDKAVMERSVWHFIVFAHLNGYSALGVTTAVFNPGRPVSSSSRIPSSRSLFASDPAGCS